MLHFFTTVTQEQDEKTGDIELNDILKSISIPEYDVYVDEDCVNCPFDVTNFLPTWLVDDHHAGNTLFVKFVQHYFDWLYCTDKSNIYMNKVFDLSDIENVNEKTVMSVLKSHIPGLYSALSKSSTVYIGDPIFEEGTGSDDQARFSISYTSNNSSYSNVVRGFSGLTDPPNEFAQSDNIEYMFDITDTSNQKIKFNIAEMESDNRLMGGSSERFTGFTFIRLGDT